MEALESGEAESLNLPLSQIEKIKEQMHKRNLSLATQLACMEYGVSKYINELDLCEDFGMTPEQLTLFKRNQANEVARAKNEFATAKFNLVRTVNKAAILRETMIQSQLQGDVEVANRLAQIILQAEAVLPMGKLVQAAEILKLVGDSEVKQGTTNQVTVNINPKLQEAQDMLEKRQRSRIMDAEVIKTEPKP